MGRPLIILLLLLSLTTLLVHAGEEKIEVTRLESGPVITPPAPMFSESSPPFLLEPVTYEDLPLQVQMQAGADECVAAPELDIPGGDITLVNGMTTSLSDPDLSPCMYGTPPSPKGYRTVWYKFIPLQSGIATIETTFDPTDYNDSYDTVVALFHATGQDCTNLALVACNDDAYGFFSRVHTFVQKWETYYIEVADWSLAVDGPATLRLAIAIDPADSLWHVETEAYTTWKKPRTRHEVVAVNDGQGNDYIFIIAGQTDPGDAPERDGRVDRFHVQSGQWDEMTPMTTASDNKGYSNSTAALVNGRIYMPAGYVGANTEYEGTHWVYEIGSGPQGKGIWFANDSPVPWEALGGPVFAWSQAVPLTVGGVSGYFLTGGVRPEGNNPTAAPVDHMLFFVPSADGRSGFWNQNLTSMSVARYAHVAGAVTRGGETQVCVAGGITLSNGEQVSTNHAECFSNISNSWQPLPPMNFNRYMADSVVGPDGRWYVYGGYTVVLINGNPVPVYLEISERYDPETNTWQMLDNRFDLDNPARAWPRGDLAGNTLWVFGGEYNNEVVPLIESMFIAPATQFHPSMSTARMGDTEPNDTLDTATPIAFFQPQYHDFAPLDDFFDVFRFQVTTPTVVSARVTEIPFPNNYDVYVYDSNKFLVGSSTNIGNLPEDAITFTLNPGTYYVMVVKVSAYHTFEPYRIEVVPLGE